MSNAITRRQIIEDEAMKWGEEYAKNLEPAVKKNKEFVEVILQLVDANNKLRASSSQKELQDNIRITNQLGERATTIWKEQNQLELALISTKKKNELATEGTNRALIKERTALAETNKELKQVAREQLGLVSSYEKLNRARKVAQDRLAELLSAEKRNIAEVVIAQQEFNKLDARVKAVDAAIRNYSKNIGNYQSAFQGLNGTLRNLMSAFGLVGGLALFGTIMKDVFNVVRDFDRQLIAVGKTTGIKGEELNKFGEEVVKLGQKLEGVSVDGLIQSAEVAGQLGVTGTDNILKFSEAIEKLKLTSNIISDEQVGQFAKFIEVSSDSFDNADRLASVITRLGNEMATTEAEVLANSTEIQKGIAVYNTSAQGVLALGAATSTLGSEAEASRSAIQSTFAVVNNAIATGKGLEKVLKLTGLTQKQLSEQFNKDATGVFQKFIKGLNTAKAEGQNLALVLDDLGIQEKRAFTVVGALAANYGVLEAAMNSAKAEYIDNAALNVEVAAASKSVASIISDIRDEFEAYVLSASSANSGTEKLAKVLVFLRDNFKEIVSFILKAGAVILTYVGVMKTVNFVTSVFTALKTAAVAAQIQYALATGIGTTKILEQTAAIRAQTAAQTGLNTAMKATPWGLIIALLLASATAYAAFNDQLSRTEQSQKKVNDALLAQKKAADESKKANEEFYSAQLKGIEDEFALRRAQQGDSDKLNKEEIEAKKKVAQNTIDVNQMQIDANVRELQEVKRISAEKIKTAEQEVAKLSAIRNSRGAGFAGNSILNEAQSELQGIKENSAKSVNALRVKNSQYIAENKKLAADLAKLGQDAAVQAATAQAEEDKKAKEAWKKRMKERYEAEKKLADDLFKLRQFRLQVAKDIDQEISENEKAEFDDRVEALLEFQQLSETKIKEAAVRELQLLGKYNEESGKFVRELSNVEIEEFIKTGKTKEKLTAEQKLIYEKYQRDLTVQAQKGEEDRRKLIDNRVDAIKKKIDAELLLEDTKLKETLRAENDLYNAELDAAKDNFRLVEEATEEHERRVFEIKKKFAIDGLKLQASSLEKTLAENDAKVESEQVSAGKRAEADNNLKTFQQQISDLETENHLENVKKKSDVEKEFATRVEELSFAIADQLIGLSNALFDARISNLDAEIDKNNEYYDNLIELAGNDEAQKDLLQKERDKKNEQIEKKKRKVMHDQAVFNKVMNLATIVAQTAMASIAALAPPPIGLGPVFGGALLPFIIGLGAAQAATVLATPIPKYKHGRKDGPEEWAITGDGGRSEVISRQDGSDARITPSRPTLTKLNRGDRVHQSVDDYNRYMRASILTSLTIERNNLNEFQAKQAFTQNYDKEMLEEMRLTRKAINNIKIPRAQNQKPIDLNHQLWVMANKKWN